MQNCRSFRYSVPRVVPAFPSNELLTVCPIYGTEEEACRVGHGTRHETFNADGATFDREEEARWEEHEGTGSLDLYGFFRE